MRLATDLSQATGQSVTSFSTNKKYYPIDVGLRQSVVTRTGADAGKSLESLVFLHLRKKYHEVFYWRDKHEIDFVTNGQDGITPYQVSFDRIKDRHEAGLAEFYQKFPQANEAVLIDEATAEAFLE